MSISQFRKAFFQEGSAPDPRTVRSWVEAGTLPGRSIGGSYYVDVEAFEATPAQSTLSGHLLKALSQRA